MKEKKEKKKEKKSRERERERERKKETIQRMWQQKSGASQKLLLLLTRIARLVQKSAAGSDQLVAIQKLLSSRWHQ